MPECADKNTRVNYKNEKMMSDDDKDMMHAEIIECAILRRCKKRRILNVCSVAIQH